MKLRLSALVSGNGSASLRIWGDKRSVGGALDAFRAAFCAADGTAAPRPSTKPRNRFKTPWGIVGGAIAGSKNRKTGFYFANYCRETAFWVFAFHLQAHAWP
jgi:hypothetical protein